MFSKTLFTAALLVALSSAQAYPAAHVALESGSGNDRKNTTVSIDINGIFKDTEKLNGVTALYLTGASGVPMDSITCTPFSSSDGTSKVAPAFGSSGPSHLSASDSIGSIVCITTYVAHAPGGPQGFGAGSSSTLVTSTAKPAPHQTSLKHASATPAHKATSASASQSTDNAASALYLPSELFGGLALAGFGLAFAL